MISAIFVLNSRGDVLVSKFFRGDVSRGIADAFRIQVLNAPAIRSPITKIGETAVLHHRVDDIYLVAASKRNVDCCLVFEVLKSLEKIFKAYFNQRVNEERIRSNFVLVYELLDEMIDYGYPQNSAIDSLKDIITQGKGKLKITSTKEEEHIKNITINATGVGVAPWRPKEKKYRKNEIFIDVIESINLLMSASGTILNANVSGQIIMKSLLSGMPECKFGLNDKLLMAREERSGSRKRRTNGVVIDDFTFHRCVRLNKFDTDRTISFIPPDGIFELMKYRSADHIHFPFRVIPIVREVGRTRVEIRVTVRASFDRKLCANDIIIKVPVPTNTATCKQNVTKGKAKYVPAEDSIVWRLKKFPGGSEISLNAALKLLESTKLEKKTWVRPPISMKFKVPMFTASGLHVRFLKVFEKSHYQTVKWVRYITQAGNYQIRI